MVILFLFSRSSWLESPTPWVNMGDDIHGYCKKISIIVVVLHRVIFFRGVENTNQVLYVCPMSLLFPVWTTPEREKYHRAMHQRALS